MILLLCNESMLLNNSEHVRDMSSAVSRVAGQYPGPIVSTLLAAAALLGTLTAFFWMLASHRADFPFFGVQALAAFSCWPCITQRSDSSQASGTDAEDAGASVTVSPCGSPSRLAPTVTQKSLC